jgi:hypothetical protein
MNKRVIFPELRANPSDASINLNFLIYTKLIQIQNVHLHISLLRGKIINYYIKDKLLMVKFQIKRL